MIKKYLKRFSFLLICGISFVTQGQEQTFYPFYDNQMQQNPANTGKHENEWNLYNQITHHQLIVPNAFNSFSLGGDYKFHFFPDLLSVGGWFFLEQLPDAPVSVSGVYASVAYHKRLGGHIFRIGIQPGMVHYGQSNLSISYPDQYDRNSGGYNPGAATGETHFFTPVSYFDFNAGMTFTYNLQPWQPEIGVMVYNILKPDLSGINTSDWFTIGAQVSATWKPSAKVTAKPMIYFTNNSGFSSLKSGGSVFYTLPTLSEKLYQAIGGVVFDLRTNNTPGALQLHLGGRIQNVSLVLGYRYPIGFGTAGAGGMNQFNLSIIYQGLNAVLNQFVLPCDVF